MNKFIPRDQIHLTPALKAFVCEAEGCAELDALEIKYSCSIQVTRTCLVIQSLLNCPEDINELEVVLWKMCQRHESKRVIQEVALNASHAYKCEMMLPRTYAAVVQLYMADIRRASKQCDFIIDHASGKVSLFGSDLAVAKARSRIIDHLTDHFGCLSVEIAEITRIVTSWNNNQLTPSKQEQQCMENENIFMDEMLREFEKMNASVTLPSVGSIINSPQYQNPLETLEMVTVWISNASATSIMSSKGHIRKKIEMEAHCVVVVRKELESFGMMPVDIFGTSKEICAAGKRLIEEMFKTKSNNDEKFPVDRNGKRNIFRDQKKILLELSPKK